MSNNFDCSTRGSAKIWLDHYSYYTTVSAFEHCGGSVARLDRSDEGNNHTVELSGGKERVVDPRIIAVFLCLLRHDGKLLRLKRDRGVRQQRRGGFLSLAALVCRPSNFCDMIRSLCTTPLSLGASVSQNWRASTTLRSIRLFIRP